MPTTDIIGYLWSRRQDFDIRSQAEAIIMAGDLVEIGLPCIEVEDAKILGQVVGASTKYLRHTADEWDALVHDKVVEASALHATHMLDGWESDDE